MNEGASTTDNTEIPTDMRILAQMWNDIDWLSVQENVSGLQARIAKAAIGGKTNQVRRLTYLLTHSFSAKALAVKQVTTNKGKRTAGIDGQRWHYPSQKMKAVLTLTDKHYKAKPLKRVYIEKKGKGTKRPLGIPTMYDRSMQALYALALDPIAEAKADGNSYGFRKGRSAHDACDHLFTALSHKVSAQWILEGDIKGCFDNINHDWLLDNIPMDKSVLKQFLKAGYIFKGDIFPTDAGTPQGGVISAILSNMCLDGMQEVLADRFSRGPRTSRYSPYWHKKHKVTFVRYADDFVATAATKEIAQEAKEILSRFLSQRGLELSDEKTLISHIDDGFDLLGWNMRKYKGKLIIKPSKKSIKSIVEKTRGIIKREGAVMTQDQLIRTLNLTLQGWANYHQYVCSKRAFKWVDNTIYEQLTKWAKRRHPRKNTTWRYKKYWHCRNGRKGWFSSDKYCLVEIGYTPIIRHIKIRSDTNAYLEASYLHKRKEIAKVRKRQAADRLKRLRNA